MQGDAVPLPERAECLVSSLISLFPPQPRSHLKQGVQGDAVLLPEREVSSLISFPPPHAAQAKYSSSYEKREIERT